MTDGLPYSQACENNKHPILDVLINVFRTPGTVLEIGSGTGQHAVHFASALPHLNWQPSDHPQANRLSEARIEHAELANIRPVIELDVAQPEWPVERVSAVFSANTAHIMAWPEVIAMFTGVGELLEAGGAFCLYGPFNYNGRYTSASNQQFDQHLKSQAAHMGIRNLEDLEVLAANAGLMLEQDHEMPANNRLLVWRKPH
ncbi:DUF938 domain-containing protein [Marinobacter sp. X15-166B]|uniref:DUF938 domain-containing protein n=1 Tax=Marinobacter sp. X15-166B TaxID=1897620 RepID=UPI00085CC808|nr:DUF938 domain-containing protein [Marinobacter sp. X15-166B]OEY67417.1 methylase [Marinobacter sp. X15-166B]